MTSEEKSIFTKMENEMSEELKNHLIPFWLSLKDEKRGGFFGYKDFSLNTDTSAEKSTKRVSDGFNDGVRLKSLPISREKARLQPVYVDCAHSSHHGAGRNVPNHTIFGALQQNGGLYRAFDGHRHLVDNDLSAIFAQYFVIA